MTRLPACMGGEVNTLAGRLKWIAVQQCSYISDVVIIVASCHGSVWNCRRKRQLRYMNDKAVNANRRAVGCSTAEYRTIREYYRSVPPRQTNRQIWKFVWLHDRSVDLQVATVLYTFSNERLAEAPSVNIKKVDQSNQKQDSLTGRFRTNLCLSIAAPKTRRDVTVRSDSVLHPELLDRTRPYRQKCNAHTDSHDINC